MATPFIPTHQLTVEYPGKKPQVVVLCLEPSERNSPFGYAYTEKEWAEDESASWEHREEGWLLDGWPLMQKHPDRDLPSSLQVELVPRATAKAPRC